MEVCPLAKTGKELILELVNAENASAITEEQLIFGEPQSTDSEQNTRLNLTAAPDSPWNSFVDVDYDRLDLNTLFHGERAEISVPKGATPADIICHLNFTYGTKFDVTEFKVTPVEDGDLPELYKVEALDNNLAYGGTFDVFVDLERMPLSARILQTDLNGFMYPNADRPSLNNPVFFKDVDGAWNDGGAQDNKLGYDRGENSEVVLGLRTSNTNGGWQQSRYPIGVKYGPAGEPRRLTTWQETNGNLTQAASWNVLVGLRYVGKTVVELIEDYDVFMETRSRASASQQWQVRTFKYRRDSDVPGASNYNTAGFWQVDGPNNFGRGAFTTVPRDGTHAMSLDRNTNIWPGLSQGSTKLTGMMEYRLWAVRKAGRAKTLEIQAAATAV